MYKTSYVTLFISTKDIFRLFKLYNYSNNWDWGKMPFLSPYDGNVASLRVTVSFFFVYLTSIEALVDTNTVSI